MKLAVLADVHANICALDAVIQDMRQQGVEQAVFLGDLVMVGPEPAAVFDTLRELNPMCWIKGNTDMWLEEMGEGWSPKTRLEQVLFDYCLYAKSRLSQEQIKFITGLSVECSIKYPGFDMLCVHGSPRSVTEIMDHRTQDSLAEIVKNVVEAIILCGHSHVPFIGEALGKYIFNVGSVGRPLDGDPRASYGIVDFATGTPQFINRRVHYSLEETLRLARDADLPHFAKYEYSLKHAAL